MQVGHVEQRIVAGDDAADRFVADHVRVADLVGGVVDFGDGVGKRIGDKDFAAVGLQRQIDRRAADIHQRFKAVGLSGVGIGLRQGDDHDLMTSRAGHERL